MAMPNTRMGQYSEKEAGVCEQARERVGEAYRETEGLVRRNPGSSALVTLGVGFGVGLLLTHLLMTPPRRRSSWLNKYHEYLPDMPSRQEIADAIAKMLPDAIARRM